MTQPFDPQPVARDTGPESASASEGNLMFPDRQLRLDDADRRLAVKVHLSLTATGRQQLREIDVRAEAGRVTLTGRVSSYFMKQLAQHAAMSVENVERLDSLLVVDSK